jgi:hypothetical protein
MAEHADETRVERQGPLPYEAAIQVVPPPATPESNAAYLKVIDNARKAVAVALAVFGAGIVICSRHNVYVVEELKTTEGIWTWQTGVSAIGVCACLCATLALIIEGLSRPATPRPIAMRSLFLRSLLVSVGVLAISFAMGLAFGPSQGVGAFFGSLLLLAAIRSRDITRASFAVLAAIVLGPTLLSTQSAYQYACRHQAELVAAGREIMDQFRAPNAGQEIPPDNPHVPSVLRKLGAEKIWVDEDFVSVYVPGFFADREFTICRLPNPPRASGHLWIKKPIGKSSGLCEINDFLWMTGR